MVFLLLPALFPVIIFHPGRNHMPAQAIDILGGEIIGEDDARGGKEREQALVVAYQDGPRIIQNAGMLEEERANRSEFRLPARSGAARR